MIELRRYQFEDKRVPVTEWLSDLRDVSARAQIEVRLRRISVGNFGDCKTVGDGVSELRVDVGAGYRFTTASMVKNLLFCCVEVTRAHNRQT